MSQKRKAAFEFLGRGREKAPRLSVFGRGSNLAVNTGENSPLLADRAEAAIESVPGVGKPVMRTLRVILPLLIVIGVVVGYGLALAELRKSENFASHMINVEPYMAAGLYAFIATVVDAVHLEVLSKGLGVKYTGPKFNFLHSLGKFATLLVLFCVITVSAQQFSLWMALNYGIGDVSSNLACGNSSFVCKDKVADAAKTAQAAGQAAGVTEGRKAADDEWIRYSKQEGQSERIINLLGSPSPPVVSNLQNGNGAFTPLQQ